MLKLIRYNDGMDAVDIWFWADSEDTLASPIFETKEDAALWIQKHPTYSKSSLEWL